MRHAWHLDRIQDYRRTHCEHCKLQRWTLMEGDARVLLYAAPKGFTREKTIWSTFKPGCI